MDGKTGGCFRRGFEGSFNGKRLQAFRAISVCHNLGRGLKAKGKSQPDTDNFNKTDCLSAREWLYTHRGSLLYPLLVE